MGYTDRLAPLIVAGLADGAVSLDRWLADGKSILNENLGAGATWTKGGKGAPLRDVRIDSFFPTLPEGVSENEIEIRIHPPFPEEAKGAPVAVHLARSLEVQLPAAPDSPLEALLSDRPWTDRRTLWIHPGAGSPEKRWPLASFLEVADRWRTQTRTEVRFLLGEADLEMTAPLEAAGFRIELPPTPLDMARLFSREDVFLGNDSGPSHLAALMGIRTLAIFVSTDPRIWGPWGSHSFVVASGGERPCLKPVDILSHLSRFGFYESQRATLLPIALL